MSKKEGIVIIPIEQFANLYDDLITRHEVATAMLKHYVENTELDLWDTSPIPILTEYYAALNTLKRMVEIKFKEELGAILTEIIEKGLDGIPLKEKELMMINTLSASIKVLAEALKYKYGVSLEVH
jgi:hypothetical protein